MQYGGGLDTSRGPRIDRKKYSGNGIKWEKKARKTESEMDGLCQPGHESNLNDKR